VQDSTNHLEVSPVTLVRTCSAANPLNNTLSSKFCLKDPSMSVVSNKPKEQNLLACSWVTPLNLVTIKKPSPPATRILYMSQLLWNPNFITMFTNTLPRYGLHPHILFPRQYYPHSYASFFHNGVPYISFDRHSVIIDTNNDSGSTSCDRTVSE
jgi:hypothetical protein